MRRELWKELNKKVKVKLNNIIKWLGNPTNATIKALKLIYSRSKPYVNSSATNPTISYLKDINAIKIEGFIHHPELSTQASTKTLVEKFALICYNWSSLDTIEIELIALKVISVPTAYACYWLYLTLVNKMSNSILQEKIQKILPKEEGK